MTNFTNNTNYTATNYRTHENVTITCKAVKVNGVYFKLANGTTYKFNVSTATMSDKLIARNDKLHLIVKSA